MPKSTKRFIISNSGLNAHGFRVLTDGVNLDDFKANPIMLWNHTRPDGKTDETLPIGFWDELKIEGDNITAIPNFDDDDPLAMKLYKKVEHGTIRAASAGLIPLQLSNSPEDMLDGQKLPTYKKSKLKEASLVDIGSNAGAVTLYSPDGALVTLAAGKLGEHFDNLLNNQQTDMKLITLSAPAILALLKLDPEKATEAEAIAEVTKIVNLSLEQAGTITTLKAEKKALEDAASEGKITTLVEVAIRDRKIVAGDKEKFVKLAHADYDTTKAVLDAMKGSAEVKDRIHTGDDNTGEVAELMKLSFDELFNNGGLVKLKALDQESYKAKYKTKFGKEPDAA